MQWAHVEFLPPAAHDAVWCHVCHVYAGADVVVYYNRTQSEVLRERNRIQLILGEQHSTPKDPCVFAPSSSQQQGSPVHQQPLHINIISQQPELLSAVLDLLLLLLLLCVPSRTGYNQWELAGEPSRVDLYPSPIPHVDGSDFWSTRFKV